MPSSPQSCSESSSTRTSATTATMTAESECLWLRDPKGQPGKGHRAGPPQKVKVATRATGPGEAPKKGKTQGAGEAGQ